jgi:CubicO group peptidase (beta-lactamase class C family)
MHKPFAILIALALLAAGCQSPPDAFRQHKAKSQPEPIFALTTQRTPQDLTPELQTFLKTHELPAIAAASVDLDGVIAVGVAGQRKIDAPASVSLDDKFHIGSCTQSMTALLAARLVDAGFIKWNTTLAQTYPGYVYHMQPQLKPITLRMLLAHRSGQSTQETNDLFMKICATPRPLLTQKALITRAALDLKPSLIPAAQPATGKANSQPTTPFGQNIPFAYSNLGYFLAAGMLEASTGQFWPKLMQNDVFAPLGLESAGFGPPAQSTIPDAPDQTWSHKWENGRLIPIPPGPDADNPEAMSPAGTVHMNVGDFASYAQFHLTNLMGQYELLTPQSAQMLYAPYPGPPITGRTVPGQKPGTDIGYAMGMVVFDHESLGRVWFHTGSNTMNTAIFVIVPSKNIAAVVMTNAAKPDTQDALLNYALNLAQQHATK